MFKMFYWGVILAITAVLPQLVCQFLCSDGRYVQSDPEGNKTCTPCPEGSFMPEAIHNHEECFLCTLVNDTETQEIESKCTRSRDAVIKCQVGHFRKTESPLLCQKCKECSAGEVLVRNCARDWDTICCKENSAWFPAEDRCLTLCGKDTYYNAAADECLPCPSGTFLGRKWHTEEHCIQPVACEVQSIHCAGSQNFNANGVLCRKCPPGTFQNLTEQPRNDSPNVSGEMSTQPAPCPGSADEDMSGLACWKWILIVSAVVVLITVTTDVIVVRLYRRHSDNGRKSICGRCQTRSVVYWTV